MLWRKWGWRSASMLFGGALVMILLVAGYSRVPGSFTAAAAPSPGRAAPPADRSELPATTAGPATAPLSAPPIRFGDRWVVMVRSAFPEAHGPWQEAEAWQFTAVGVRADQVAVEARPAGSRRDAPVMLLIDPATGGLLRSRVAVPAKYGPKLIERHYEPARPGLAELSPVPIDRPAFPLRVPEAAVAGGPPSETVYDGVRSAPTGRVQFGGRTRQRVYACGPAAGRARLRQGLREAGHTVPAKLAASPRCRVELFAPGGEKVEQLWSPVIPWPLYSASATTRAWLIDFRPGSPRG